MDIKDFSNIIYKKCKDSGLCPKGIEQWDGSSEESLIRMYVKEPEFLIKHKPISLYFVRDNFNKSVLNENNVYLLEDTLDLQTKGKPKDFIFNACNGTISVNTKDNIFTISDNSELSFLFKETGYFTINVFDNSEIFISCPKDCNVVIFSYGDNMIQKVCNEGKIKIINK